MRLRREYFGKFETGADMSHKSRLGVIVIDCQTDDLQDAAAFWAGALGAEAAIDADGKYAAIGSREASPVVLLQAVDHDPRVHLDIESDDPAAEIARLAALGAKPLHKAKTWTVMEAPTGHRFCVVNPQNASFDVTATSWGET